MRHPIMGFEHLHRHSDFSLLDGFARVSEYAEYQKEINQKFLCITDHGVMGAIPQQVAEAEKHNLFPLFGVEFYVNPMQPKLNSRAESAEFRKNLGDESLQKKFDKSHHLLAIAYNDVGYSNLVRLTSWAWIHGFYRRPRINHEILMQHKEGIVFTSTCGNSEIANAFMGGRIVDEERTTNPDKPKYKVVYDEDAGMAMVEKYMAMFGEHFYLELMMLDWVQQRPYNEFLIRAHDKYHIPLILSQDCHYCRKEHSQNQRLMLMQQNKRTLAEVEAMIANGEADDIFELQDTNLWLKSEDELNSMWEFNFQSSIDYELFKQAKANTVKIAEFAKNVQIDRGIKLPKIPDADTVLWEEILKGFKQRGCPKTPTYIKRIREEYDLITEKGFASYFIIQKMMVDEARRKSPEIMGFGDGSEAVGPGRGCLHPLTPIRLENGIVHPIREVKIGDRVYTIDGTLREVQKIMTYPLNNEPLLRINTFYGDCFGVPLTLDHKVYAERKLDSKELKISGNNFQEPKGNCDWVEARNLNVGDWCFVPTPLVKEIEDFECDLSQFSDANFFTDHKFTFDDNFVYQKSSLKENAIEIQRHWKLTPEWAYLLGVFANDGWTCEKQFGKVYFSSDSRQNHLDHVFEMIQRCGLNSSLVEREYGEDSHQLIINSSCIQMLFEFLHPNYFYSSQTKCVPDCILKGPLNIVESYISGCFKNNNHKIETTSQVLAEQIRFLLLRLGLPSSLLSKTKKDCSNLGVLYTIDRPVGYHINGSVENGWKRVPNGIMLRIREISEIRDVDHVCDIQVEGNHNYLTSSFLVHNSVCGSLVAYCLRLHDVEPIIHDLRFSRFLSPARGGKQQKFRHTIQPLSHQEFPLD